MCQEPPNLGDGLMNRKHGRITMTEMYHMVYMGLYHDTGCIAYGVWDICDTLETLHNRCVFGRASESTARVRLLVAAFRTIAPRNRLPLGESSASDVGPIERSASMVQTWRDMWASLLPSFSDSPHPLDQLHQSNLTYVSTRYKLRD